MSAPRVSEAFEMPALLNRERAILEFNRRVLAQARRADVPLLERLRYVCIVSSNMDEFFEVRFADLQLIKRCKIVIHPHLPDM